MTSPQTPKPGQRTPEEQAAEQVFNVGCLGIVVVLGCIWIFTACQDSFKDPAKKALEESQRKEKVVNEWFNGGSEYSCESNLKEQLRDPNSYERDGDFTTPSNDGKKRIITWKFRAKNGFGGYTPGIGMCLITKENGGTVKATTLGQ